MTRKEDRTASMSSAILAEPTEKGSPAEVDGIHLSIVRDENGPRAVDPKSYLFPDGIDVSFRQIGPIEVRHECAVIAAAYAKRHMYIYPEGAMIRREYRIKTLHSGHGD